MDKDLVLQVLKFQTHIADFKQEYKYNRIILNLTCQSYIPLQAQGYYLFSSLDLDAGCEVKFV